jgi:hypothetical protein
MSTTIDLTTVGEHLTEHLAGPTTALTGTFADVSRSLADRLPDADTASELFDDAVHVLGDVADTGSEMAVITTRRTLRIARSSAELARRHPRTAGGLAAAAVALVAFVLIRRRRPGADIVDIDHRSAA